MKKQKDSLSLTQAFSQVARIAGAVAVTAAAVAATLYVLGKETDLLDGTPLDVFNPDKSALSDSSNIPTPPALPVVIETAPEVAVPEVVAPEAAEPEIVEPDIIEPESAAPVAAEPAEETPALQTQDTAEPVTPEVIAPEAVTLEEIAPEPETETAESETVESETPPVAEQAPEENAQDETAQDEAVQNETAQDETAPDTEKRERVLLPELPPSALPYAVPDQNLNNAREAIEHVLRGTPPASTADEEAALEEDEEEDDPAVLQEEGELVDIALPQPRPDREQQWWDGLSHQERIRVRVIEAVLEKEGKNKPSWVVHDALAYAHRYTGVDLMYMYRLANAESSFRPHAHNSAGGGRGACGLFQFRGSSTYLETIYNHRANLPQEYSHIGQSVERYINKKGEPRYRVKAGADAKTVFDACYNARFSAVLGGFFTRDLYQSITDKSNLRRAITHADLYISHFLGINGGPRIIRVHGNSKNHAASITNYVTAGQRSANRGIFNRVSTVAGFYNFFVNNKGMTNTAFQLGDGQFAQLRFPDVVPLPEPRPDIEREMAQVHTVERPAHLQYGGPR